MDMIEMLYTNRLQISDDEVFLVMSLLNSNRMNDMDDPTWSKVHASLWKKLATIHNHIQAEKDLTQA